MSWDAVRPRPSRSWPARDLLALLGIGALTALGAAVTGSASEPVREQLDQALTLVAAAGAAAASIVVAFGARLTGDVAALRLGSALIVYGGVVLPVTAGLSTSAGQLGLLVDLLCFGTVTVLFGLALTGRGDPAVAWPTAAVAVALGLGVAGIAALVPSLMPSPGVLVVALDAVLLAWGGTGLLLVGQGVRRRHGLLRRTGLGVCLITGAHVARLVQGPDLGEPYLPLSGLRVVGIGVLLAGAVGYTVAAMRRQRADDLAAARRLREAEEAERAAERDAAERAHEMRNVMAGLSGAATLFSSGGATTGHEALGRALQAELWRLGELIDPAGAAAHPPAEFAVDGVLGSVVALQRARGVQVGLAVPGGLVASGSSTALSQAVTNLLLNCERHAPGARVEVAAHRDGSRIAVVVSDDGPGLPPGTEHAALRRGWTGPRSRGSGLGLDISRRLMREHGGELRLLPVRPGTGCQVVLELRASETPSVPAPARPSGGILPAERTRSG